MIPVRQKRQRLRVEPPRIVRIPFQDRVGLLLNLFVPVDLPVQLTRVERPQFGVLGRAVQPFPSEYGSRFERPQSIVFAQLRFRRRQLLGRVGLLGFARGAYADAQHQSDETAEGKHL